MARRSRKREPAIAPALRTPIASALADCAGDTYEVLSGVNPDYYRREDRAPWRDGPIVRMPADPIDVVRVMRAVSDAPSAYAALRAAQTHECAIRLAGVPAKATGDRLRAPARDCASGLGFLDGIADDIPEAERQAWQAGVLNSLTNDSTKPPNYRDDAVRHLTGTWRQGLVRGKPSETWFLREQITDLVHTWALGRGMDPDSDEVDNLQEDALNDASTRLGETEKTMKCTRKPEEQPCP